MRLFIAIEVPEAWRAAAASLQAAMPAGLRRVLRFVDPSLMHVTLRFIGEVDETPAAILDSVLSERIVEPSVRLALGRAGTFGPPARTDVVHVAVEGDLQALGALVARIETAAQDAGQSPERRSLRPHVTLARVQRHATPADRRAIAEAVERLEAPEPHEFVASEVVLVQSHLGSGAPRYEVVTRYG